MTTMSDLSKLLSLEPNSLEWEAERSRLIREAIASAPKHLQKKLTALQYELDIDRQAMSPEDFMKSLTSRLEENLLNLEDLVSAIDHLSVSRK